MKTDKPASDTADTEQALLIEGLREEVRRMKADLSAHRTLLKRVGRRLMDIYADIQNPQGCSAGKMSKWMRKLAHECRELEAAALTEKSNGK